MLIELLVDRYVVVTFHILHMLQKPTEDTVPEVSVSLTIPYYGQGGR
jgi:hypothetical protein